MIKVGDIIESLCDFDKGRTTIPKGSLGKVVHEDITIKWFEASFIDPQSGANVILSLDLKSEGINWRLHSVASDVQITFFPMIHKGNIDTDVVDSRASKVADAFNCPVTKEKKVNSVPFVGSHNLPYNSDYDDPFDDLWRYK